MPFREENQSLLRLDTIHTDADAEKWLPPYPLVHQAYADCRVKGLTPSASLEDTLLMWREIQVSARPSGYGRGDRTT